jgi:hypothetical protein
MRRFWRRRAENADGLPPRPKSQRLIVAAVALATTLLIGAGLIAPHLDFLRARREAAQPKPCAPGQTRDCVGGTMGVIVAPPAPSASR